MSLASFSLMEVHSQLKRSDASGPVLFDPVRKKWVMENPEELVRQSLIIWLNLTHSIPYSRMAVEKQIQVLGLTKRYDLVIYNKSAVPFILIECKSPELPIHQKMFDQAAIYNMKLQAPFLGICNGIEFRICEIDFEKKIYHFVQEIPSYPF